MPAPAGIRPFVQIRLRPKFGQISGFQPDLQNVMLTGKTRFVYLSFHAITSRCLRDLAQQRVDGGTRSFCEVHSLHYRNSHTVASSLVRNTTKYCSLNITINEDNPAPVGFANTNPALAGFRNLESGTALNFIASYLLYISACRLCTFLLCIAH